MNRVNKYILLAYASEAKKRADLKKRIRLVVETRYKTGLPLATKRGKVYQNMAKLLGFTCNVAFMKVVRSTLEEMGIRPVCYHKTYLFRNLWTDEDLDQWFNAYQVKQNKIQIPKASGKLLHASAGAAESTY